MADVKIRVKITRDKSNQIKVLTLEEYLRGVVPAEMYSSWHTEALKSQAVAARTYAYKRILSEKSKAFDVDDTTNTQAYVPAKISDFTDAAVKATSGEILTYNRKPIDSVFTASNGGNVVSAKQRWGNDIPYLIAKPDPMDKHKKSGHGVGLSQYGARARADKGDSYKDILAFYYPGATLGQIPVEKESKPMAINSKVILANASIDERGKITGGASGDQTAKEVTTREWYLHDKGWVMIRPADAFKGQLMANAAIAGCNNPNIGYDQNQRNTLYEQAKKVNFELSKVDVKCETDCSAFIRVCAAYAGITLPDFNTSTMVTALTSSGYFTKHIDPKYTTKPDFLNIGDILVTKTKGHTVIVVENGSPASFKGKAEVSGSSVNVRTGPSTDDEIIAIFRRGNVVEVTGNKADGWHEVAKGNVVGWMSDKYLKFI